MARKKGFFKRVKIGTKKSKKSSWGKYIKIFLILFVLFIGLPAGIGSIWFYENIYKDLPSISKIEKIQFSQASVITDRNGEVLYKLFDENRDYIGFDQVSENMVNAIIATEDKEFWDNPGIDIGGMVRAGIYDVTHPNEPLQGGSTITQQLIKNLLLNKRKLIKRKLKEIVLALKLDDYLKENLRIKYGQLGKKELQRKMKEKILELYLNYIFFGNNSYGIEAASEKYFNKSADQLNVLESSVLAGLPKAPSKYDPYDNRGNVMGQLVAYNSSGQKVKISDVMREQIVNKIDNNLKDRTLIGKTSAGSLINFFQEQSSFKINIGEANYKVEYSIGRKDIVLFRMYLEDYISAKKLKEKFVDSFSFEFASTKTQIKAPHFVFRVIDRLKDKYGEDLLRQGGLTIKTTLDYNKQKLAKKAMKENFEQNNLQDKGVSNSSMLYVDSQNGDVLTYLGSRDYSNDKIDGKSDMIQAKRQPGSIIKPLVYALGFMKNNYTLDTPTYDVPFEINNNNPQNVDGQFLGLLPLRKALAYSRNIPAIKMYFKVGREAGLKSFLEKLGVTSLSDSTNYGYPLAIGAGEIPMMQMAKSYMHLSRLGKPAKINPILSIKDSDGSIVYKKSIDKKEQVIPSGISYMIRKILSEKDNFPPSWRSNYSYNDLPLGTKSGTTNVEKNGKSYPRDGWMSIYTPNKVLLSWVGNADGSPMDRDVFGGDLNAGNWKGFIEKLNSRDYKDFQKENLKMESTSSTSINISKITGKKVGIGTPLAFVKNTIGYIKNLPDKGKGKIETIEVDSLCTGAVSEYTPDGAKEKGYVIDPVSMMPNERDKEDIIEWWKKDGLEKYSKKINSPVFLEKPEKICKEREKIANEGKLKSKFLHPQTNGQHVARQFSVWFQVNSPFEVSKIEFFVDDQKIDTFNYSGTNKSNIADIKVLLLPESLKAGKYELTIKAFDKKGYKTSSSQNINLLDKDEEKPYLVKDKTTINQTENGYNLTVIFRDDVSFVREGKIMQDGEVIKTFRSSVVNIDLESLKGLEYEIVDNFGNKAKGKIED